jgi:hypothetical protein
MTKPKTKALIVPLEVRDRFCAAFAQGVSECHIDAAAGIYLDALYDLMRRGNKLKRAQTEARKEGKTVRFNNEQLAAIDFYDTFTQALATRDREKRWMALDHPLPPHLRRLLGASICQTRDRLLKKFERDVELFTKLKENYLTAWTEGNPEPTQIDVSKVIAKGKGIDVNDLCNRQYLLDARRHIGATLKKLGLSWSELEFVKSYEPEDPEREN